jgi:hypothetical protein
MQAWCNHIHIVVQLLSVMQLGYWRCKPGVITTAMCGLRKPVISKRLIQGDSNVS